MTYLEALTEELKTHGVDDWVLDDQGRHYKLRFEWGGRSMMQVSPRTPSDRRGVLNALSDLRGILGVRRVVLKSKGRKRRVRPVAPARTKLLTITVKSDPFAVLAQFKEPAK